MYSQGQLLGGPETAPAQYHLYRSSGPGEHVERSTDAVHFGLQLKELKAKYSIINAQRADEDKRRGAFLREVGSRIALLEKAEQSKRGFNLQTESVVRKQLQNKIRMNMQMLRESAAERSVAANRSNSRRAHFDHRSPRKHHVQPLPGASRKAGGPTPPKGPHPYSAVSGRAAAPRSREVEKMMNSSIASVEL